MVKLFYKLTLLLLLTLSATVLYQKHTYAYHTLTQINPIPQTKKLIVEERYVEAYNYLNYFMEFDYVKENPDAQALLKQIEDKRASFEYRSEKFAEGIRTGTSDEALGKASAIGSDFFLIGDLRDLALEGTHYYNNEEVDSVLVALSSIGLVASASTLFTLGSSAVAKSGVSFLKLAHKSKAIPKWLNQYLIRQGKHIRKTKDISTLKPLFQTLDSLQKRVGINDTIKLLSRTASLNELKSVTKLTQRYGKQTPMLLKLSDKQVLTHTAKLSKVNKQTINLASTFGVNGFVHLLKGGEKHFIKTTKRMKAYSKVGYKGEIWKMFLSLMKYLSDTVLILIMSIASLMLLPFRKMKRLLTPHHSKRS